MSYKSSSQENPVGPDSPAFNFPFSMGQVLVALLLLAIGLTIWKQYEAKYIAPRTTIRWSPFSIEALKHAARRHIDVLVVLDPSDASELLKMNERLADPEFQKAVFLARPLLQRIDSFTSLDEASAKWIDSNWPDVVPGKLLWIPGGDLLNYKMFNNNEIGEVLQSLTSRR